jgi:hypothetical protein
MKHFHSSHFDISPPNTLSVIRIGRQGEPCGTRDRSISFTGATLTVFCVDSRARALVKYFFIILLLLSRVCEERVRKQIINQ